MAVKHKHVEALSSKESAVPLLMNHREVSFPHFLTLNKKWTINVVKNVVFLRQTAFYDWVHVLKYSILNTFNDGS